MATTNLTLTCPQPFLTASAYPSTGGYLAGRFCGPVTPELSCCLPCPLERWVYSDSFTYKTHVAYWFNVPALICQVFLLVSFVVLPEDKSGKHYLSVGLCVALVLLEVSVGLFGGRAVD